MRWWFFSIPIVVIIFIGYLISQGVIALDAGAVFGFLSILPPILDYALSANASLKIKNPKFIKEEINQLYGYQLKATVISKGKKICYNLEPSFEIKDKNGNIPNLINVNIVEISGNETKTIKEKPMSTIGHAWMDKSGNVTSTHVVKELRKDDKVDLLFPYETMYVASGNSSSSYEYFLKLDTNIDYVVKITVKGEDSEKNTVTAIKKVTIEPIE